MPKRPPRLPSLPVTATSQQSEAWREKAWRIVSGEVANRFLVVHGDVIVDDGHFILDDALDALKTGRGARAYARAMDALDMCDGDEEDFQKFRRLFLAWLEPFINEELGKKKRAHPRTIRTGKYKRISVEELARSAAYFALVDLILPALKEAAREGKAEVRVDPEWLRAAVEVVRARDLSKRHPTLTFSDACSLVATRFDYKKSAKQVIHAAELSKWSNPRRRN